MELKLSMRKHFHSLSLIPFVSSFSMVSKTAFILVSILFIFCPAISLSLPLSVNGRWITDDASGSRVKLHCANWPGHIDTMVPEGLDKQPLDNITSTVAALGFNCVRLTYAIFMYTRPEYSQLTLSQSFDNLHLSDAKAAIAQLNPSLVDLKVGDVHEAVINSLGNKSVMVIYDNHISRPMWCCSEDDGNGFFHDADFDPTEWLAGLNASTTRYKDNQWVVAMSLRNELRGRRQTVSDWFDYMHQGAQTIHAAKPNALVLISGLNYDTDFSFMRNMELGTQLDTKLLFEFHWYAFSQSNSQDNWATQPLYQSCGYYKQWFEDQAAFIYRNDTKPYPVILTEFGLDERGTDVGANNYLTCLSTIAAGDDLDWAVWALQGSYYIRSGVAGTEEDYGVLDNSWTAPRNPDVFKRFKLLQQQLQDPIASTAYHIVIFHPVTGACAMANVKDNNVYRQDCSKKSGWEHTGDGAPITLSGTASCLRANGQGLAATLSNQCNDTMSMWSLLSGLRLHIGVKDHEGVDLCLEWGVVGDAATTGLVTNKCNLESTASENQWFQLLPANLK